MTRGQYHSKHGPGGGCSVYCSHCGGEIPEGSKYCKRCGGSLASSDSAAPQIVYQPKVTGAAWAMSLAAIVITLGGLGIVLSTAYSVTRPWGTNQISDEVATIAVVTIVFGSAAIFGIVAMLIKFLSRMIGGTSAANRGSRKLNAPARGDLVGEIAPFQLRRPSIPIGSVTEHTTRTFNHPAYREPGAEDR